MKIKLNFFDIFSVLDLTLVFSSCYGEYAWYKRNFIHSGFDNLLPDVSWGSTY